MRHISLKNLINTIFAGVAGKRDKQRLVNAHNAVKAKLKSQRQKYINKNGSTKWSPIKNRMVKKLGNKCWYTEAELVGADLTIDHYRPKVEYWWLAFDVENFRVACAYANSPKHDEERGVTGGKGDAFPLLPPKIRATSKRKLKNERPVILDPCKKGDCDLIVFDYDGRPIINPTYAADPIAVHRVEESKILLNLDHSHFNAKRGELYHAIAKEVRLYEKLPVADPDRIAIRDGLEKMISAKAQFSSAARHYLLFHQHLPWVKELLDK